MDPDAQGIADLVYHAIQRATQTTDRALQQAEHRIGMSDLGHCREYARRMITQEPFTDERDKTAAFLGTVIGIGTESALAVEHPDWLFQTEVVTTLPSGLAILGHPDIIDPKANRLIDLKTKDGLELARREGPTGQQQFQRHGYALGAVQAGLLDPEGLTVANVYIDRSGAETVPHVDVEPWQPDIGEQIDDWLEDVLYAVKTGEQASRDKPRDWCERWCEFYTGCRLGDTDVTGVIEDEHAIAAIDMYLEGMGMERDGKRLKDQAKSALVGVAGSTGSHILRWVDIGPSEIPATTRRGYSKIDLRKAP